MVQLWIDTDDDVDIRRLIRGTSSDQLRRIAVFDAVINNADRKGGHLLPTRAGHIYGVDHGVSFHAEPKLRTLLWQWSGRPLRTNASDTLRQVQAGLAGDLGERLAGLLTPREVRSTVRRIEQLLGSGRHPEPSGEWPAVPWPPI
jgi:uncharacterized repeat protein (TIGR03843 family)